MIEPKINIHLSATADTKVLKAATKEIKDQAHELKNSATNVAKAWADAGQKMSKVAKEHAKAVKALTPPAASTPAAQKPPSRRGSTTARGAASTAASTQAAAPPEASPSGSTASSARGSSSPRKAAAAKKAAAKKAAAKKVAAKKAAAKKAADKRAAMKKAAAKKAAEKKAKEKKAKEKKAKEKRSKAPKKDRAAAKKAPGRSNKKYGSSPAGKTARTAKKDQQAPKTWWGQTRETLRKNWKPTDLKSKSFIPDLSYEGLKGALPPQLGMAVSVMETAAKLIGRLIDGNEKLSKSYTNLSSAASTFGHELGEAWLDEWLGGGDDVASIMDDITVALGGQSEAMKKVNEPLTKYKNAMEIAKEAQDKFNDSLEKQRDLLDETRDGLEDQLELRNAQRRRDENKLEQDAETALQRVDDSDADEATKEKQRHAIKRQLELKKYALNKQAREEEMKVNQEDLKNRRESLASAESALAKQNSRVELASQLEEARKTVDNDNENAKRSAIDGTDPLVQKTHQMNRDRLAKLEQEAKEKRLLTATEEQKNLPKLEENVRLQKEETMALEKKVRQEEKLQAIQQGQEADTTKHKLKELDREHGQPARADPVLDTSLPVMPAAPPPPPPPPPGKARADTSTEATRAANDVMRAAYNDDQGDTQKEGAVIAQFQEAVSKESADRGAALKQALQAMLALQQGGSQMERQLTSVLSAYGSQLSQISSSLREHEARLNNNDVINRR